MYKGNKARERVQRKKQAKEEEEAATKIQSVYRGRLVRVDFGRHATAADKKPAGARSDDYMMAFLDFLPESICT